MDDWDKIPISYNLCGKSLDLLDLLSAQAPFVLKSGVQAHLNNILGPPLTPASQHDLFRVFREVIDSPGTEKVLSAYNMENECQRIPLHWLSSWGFLPSGTVLASGMLIVNPKSFPASFVSGIRPGETATTLHSGSVRRQ